MNAAGLALENIERFGTYVSLHYEGQSFTNLQQVAYAGAVSRVLTDRGVTAGDRVLLMMPNSPDILAAFYAIWTIGAAVVPVAPQLKVEELAYLIRNSGTRLGITVPALAETVRAAGIEELLVFGGSELPSRPAPEDGIEEPLDRQPGDIAMILYTSGTTAHPKGVMLTHGNLVAAVESCVRKNPILPGGSYLQCLPLSHVYGILMFQLAMAWGWTSAMLRGFEVGKALAAIQEHKVQRIAAVPAILVYMLQTPEREKYDTSSLTKVLSGGAALPERLRERFEQAFRCSVNQGYGLSETAAIATSYFDDEPYRPGSAGAPQPDVELRIVGAGGEVLPPRQTGEICLRGPMVAAGYWNDAETTSQAFCDGWLRTGDIGYVDEDGYLFITDRKKDLIIKGGENISPREIEEILHGHPGVAEAAVIGVPDDLFGENICAVVVLRSGAAVTAEEIRTHTAAHLSKFKVPAQVVFQPALPRNLAGKILKREIRRQLAGA